MLKCWAPMDPTSSGHHPIIFQMAIADDATPKRMRTSKKVTKFSFKKADWRKFNEGVRSHLCSQNYHAVSSNIDSQYNCFQQAMMKAARRAIPRGCRRDPVFFGGMTISKWR